MAQSQILHGLLPAAVIEAVESGGKAAVAKHHENISVLFADIVRSAPFPARLLTSASRRSDAARKASPC
jgi:hypothetical protein